MSIECKTESCSRIIHGRQFGCTSCNQDRYDEVIEEIETIKDYMSEQGWYDYGVELESWDE